MKSATLGGARDHESSDAPLPESGRSSLAFTIAQEPSSTPRRVTLAVSATTDRRYEDRIILGEGGMGTVRLVHDRRLGRQVALKSLKPEHAQRTISHERFRREAWVQAQLDHPSVVPIHDIDEDDEGNTFFTMKRVGGETLDRVLHRLRRRGDSGETKYSLRKLLTAFANVCMAVHCAHSRGIIHRDLKPANIMFGEYGEVYILDWGIAKLDDSGISLADATPDVLTDPTETSAGVLLGTLGYMAPEQVLGAGDAQGPHTDVYSLGAILFEIILLQPLHETGSQEELAERTLAGVEARASLRAPGRNVPQELEALWLSALETHPERRTISAKGLSEGIEHYLDQCLDLERRRTLAIEYVGLAQATAERVIADPSQAEERKLAMQQLGQAMAFDPGNRQATEIFTQLVTTPPTTVPSEVAQELDQIEEKTIQDVVALTSRLTLIGGLSAVPLMLLTGVRSWPNALMFAGSILTIGFWMRAMKSRRLAQLRSGWSFMPLIVLAQIAIGISCTFFSSLGSLPWGFLLAVSVLSAVYMPRGAEWALLWTVLGGMAAMVIPFVLSAWGFGPPMLEYRGNDSVVIHAWTHFYEPRLTTGLLFLGGFLMVGTVTWVVSKTNRNIVKSRVEHHLVAWHLRHMVPTGQKENLGDTIPSRRI